MAVYITVSGRVSSIQYNAINKQASLQVKEAEGKITYSFEFVGHQAEVLSIHATKGRFMTIEGSIVACDVDYIDLSGKSFVLGALR